MPNQINLVQLKDVVLRNDIPSTVLSHPGMIAADERNLLYTLSADHYSGEGCIVDAGAFLGASTMAFACGLQKNGRWTELPASSMPIESFERGIVYKNFERHARKACLPVPRIGESFEHILRLLLNPVRHNIRLHVGDILDFDPAPFREIEICFLDILKSEAVALHCLRAFFPHLLPGAYVIQQDYFFDELPFIRYSMESLSEYFEYLGEIKSSALFRLQRSIDVRDLPESFEELDANTKLRLHRQAELRTRHPVRQYLMQLSRTRLLIELEEYGAAESVWSEANEKYAPYVRTDRGDYLPSIAWRISPLEAYLARRRALTEVRKRRIKRLGAEASHLQDISLCEAPPPEVLSHPGMSAPAERNLLYTLAAYHYSGKGCIVDAGSFLGASTMALARGLQQRSVSTKSHPPQMPVQAFEQAIAHEDFQVHAEKCALPTVEPGKSFRHVLEQLLQPVHDEVNLHVGDIVEFDGVSLPDIEICFLDVARNARIALHCMKLFFPRLLPGAYVVQREYFHHDRPFLKYSLECLAEHFEYLGELQSCALFRVRKPIALTDLPASFDQLGADTKLRLHRQAELRTEHPVRQYFMQLSRAHLLTDLADLPAAESVWKAADEEYAPYVKTTQGEYQTSIVWRTQLLKDRMARRAPRSDVRDTEAPEFREKTFEKQVLMLSEKEGARAARDYFLSGVEDLLRADVHPVETVKHLMHLSRTVQYGKGAKHGYHALLRKARRITEFIKEFESLPGGFIDLGCGIHDPVALSAFHYLNGFCPCYAIDSREPRNYRYIALSMYDILSNVLCFPERYCLEGTETNALLKRAHRLDLGALEAGDFWRGLRGVKDEVRLKTEDILISEIEEESISRVVSFAVLQRIDDIDAVCEKLYKIVKPGGIVFHFVDLVDYRSYLQGTQFDAFSFLTQEDPPKHTNRLRANEIAEAHERHGFEVLKDVRRSGAIPESTRQRLLPKYRSMRLEDVAATKQNLVVRRI